MTLIETVLRYSRKIRVREAAKGIPGVGRVHARCTSPGSGDWVEFS